MISVVYPGTFDPPHLGHLDIVRRSCEIFDRVVVAIARSPRKYLLFNLEERLDMFRVMVEPLGPKVEVKGFDGLLVDFMRKERLRVIVRGVRLFTDFEYELQIALNNSKLAGVETIFMMLSGIHTHKLHHSKGHSQLLRNFRGLGAFLCGKKAKRKVQLPLTLTLHAFPFYILLHLLQCSVSRQ
jgi:pantetheine-phosphate adenylyltransferase